MSSDIDAADFVLIVGNTIIKEFTGLSDWRVDKEVTYNEGPGGRVFGFNHQRRSNKVSFSFSVRETSPDLKKLQEYIYSEKSVAIKAIITDENAIANYQQGQEVGLGCESGIIMGGSRGKGQGEAEDVTFEVIGIGPKTYYKDEAGIVDETGSKFSFAPENA